MITGYPRSGSTLLEHCLVQDTQIPSADENTAFRDLVWRKVRSSSSSGEALWKTINEPSLPAKAGKLNEKSPVQAYQAALAELADAPSHSAAIFDKNPQLLMNLPQILRFLPHLPIIAIHRHPGDVMLSCYAQDFGLNTHSVNYLSFEFLSRHLKKISSLSQQLKDVLGDQMTVCAYEKLVCHPAEERKNIAAQLNNFPSSFSELETDEKEPRLSYSPTYAEASRPIYHSAMNRWQNYRQWIEPFVD